MELKTKNERELLKMFGEDVDLISRKFIVSGRAATIYCLNGLADTKSVADFVMRALLVSDTRIDDVNDLIEKVVFHLSVKAETSFDNAVKDFLNGYAILFLECSDEFLVIDTQTVEGRSIVEPPTSGVTKGPREGFVENIRTNLNLIRKRLKTPDFKVETMTMGKYTQTAIAICYISTITDYKIVRRIKERLSRYKIDGVMDSSYIAGFLDPSKHKLFRMASSCEKPDVAVSKLLEGRVAIVVDGSPIVVTVPYLFIEDLQSPEDYYITPQTASLGRYLRLLSMIASIVVPALYVSLEIYNYQIIPTSFLITIINATQNIPMSALSEMLLVIIIFDIIREANSRMPRTAGLALSILGAIVLGQAAVSAGLLGAPAVVIGAVSGIGLYAMPDNTLIFSLLRILFTFIGGIMGIYGIMIGMLMLISIMVSKGQFGTPYLAPLAPKIPSDLEDAVSKKSLGAIKRRPQSIRNKNKIRFRIEKK